MNCSFSTLLLYSEQYNKNNIDESKPTPKKTGNHGDNKGVDEGGGGKDVTMTDEEEGDDDEEDKKLPVVGLSCFAYLAIAEEIEAERLPSVYR